jgi:hypothetical protein
VEKMKKLICMMVMFLTLCFSGIAHALFVKSSSEAFQVHHDFYRTDAKGWLVAGESLLTAAVTCFDNTTGLETTSTMIYSSSITDGSQTGSEVTYKLYGGTNGKTYTVKILVTTSAGNTYEDRGYLVVDDVGIPASVKSCRVYEYLTNQDDYTKPSGIVAKAKIKVLPYSYNGTLHSGSVVEGTYNATTGLVYWDLAWGAQVEVTIDNFTPFSGKSIRIPQQESKRLSDL